MSKDWKPVICVDFDGVIHSYERGWADGTIYGDVVAGFFEWAERAQAHFSIVIYSSRSATDAGVAAMALWLQKKYVEWQQGDEARTDGPALEVTYADTKPKAFLTIDDRAVRFDGDWGAPELAPETLAAFTPWTRQK